MIKTGKTTIQILLLFPILLFIFNSCDDLIEKNLEKKTLAILAPTEGLVTSNTSMTFWWETLDGANEYNVQVVSPSFQQVQKLWADTTVTGDKFLMQLIPGNYQWRIRGANGSSATEFITISFVIDSTLNIAEETITLLSPKDNDASNKLSQLFKWSMLYNAGEYRFQIANNSNILLMDTITFALESSFKFPEDGYYTWSVRGQNDISNTQYTTYGIHIDTQKPEQALLKTPSHNSNVTTDSIYFTWARPEDNGSPLFDSLYVFEDEDLKRKILSKKLDSTSYNDSLAPGMYYWYVKTCDKAGNIGEKSTVFKFTKN